MPNNHPLTDNGQPCGCQCFPVRPDWWVCYCDLGWAAPSSAAR